MNSVVALYLWQPGSPENSRVSWHACGSSTGGQQETGHLFSGEGNFQEFLLAYQGAYPDKSANKKKSSTPVVIGLLPGTQVSYLNVTIPTRNRQKMLQALPYAVEEFVIGDVDTMRLGVDQQDASGRVRVAVVDRQLIMSWQQLMLESGLEFNKLCALPDILTVSAKHACLTIFSEIVLFRSENFCLQFALANIADILSLVGSDEFERLSIFSEKGNKPAQQVAKRIQLEMQADGLIEVDINDFQGDFYEFFSSQPEFSVKHKMDLAHEATGSASGWYLDISFWRPALVAACIFLVVQIGLNFSAGYFFNRRAENIDQNAINYYQKLFPDEKVLDVKAQWQVRLQRISEFQDENTFNKIFPVVMQEFLKQDKNSFVLNKFRFDGESRELKIDIDVKSVAILDSVKESLKSSGYSMNVISANEDKGNIKTSLVVKAL